MISIFHENFKSFNSFDQIIYDQVVSQIDLSLITCPCCGEKGLFVVHGYYTRHITLDLSLYHDVTHFVSKTQKISLIIKRIKCKHCGATHALFPSCLVAYCQLSLDHQVEIVHASTLDDIKVISETKFPYVDHSTFLRIRKKFTNLSADPDTPIINRFNKLTTLLSNTIFMSGFKRKRFFYSFLSVST